MLRKLERSLPSITNLSTGPAPWTIDEVSMVVTPTGHREAGIHSGTLCPSVALKKLAEYGYRPTDGWYDHPTVGYESDDPLTPRKFKFVRGQVLNQWYSEQFESGTFDDEKLVPDYGFLPGLDWERIVESAQMQIISHRQLHELAHAHQGRF